MLGPADISDRIVRAGPLVGRVITAGSVAAREPHFDLFAESILPGQVHLRLADDDQATAVAQHFQRLLGRAVGGGRGGEDRGIDAETVSPGACLLPQVLLPGNDDSFRAHRRGQRAPGGCDVEREHARSAGTQESGNQQADESLSNDQHPLAQGGLQLPYGLKRNGRDGRVGGLPVIDAVRDVGGQHVGDRGVFGMKRAFGAADCNTITDAETRVARVDRLDDARGAIAERAGNLQTVTDFLDRRAPAERFGRVEYLPHLVRARARLLQQVHARLLDFHLLRADTDDGVGEAHQDAARWGSGERHVLQLEPAVLVLGNLLQMSSPRILTGLPASPNR